MAPSQQGPQWSWEMLPCLGCRAVDELQGPRAAWEHPDTLPHSQDVFSLSWSHWAVPRGLGAGGGDSGAPLGWVSKGPVQLLAQGQGNTPGKRLCQRKSC